METMKNTVMNLPDELIIQIFLRLPVKSLIRFKCVCKYWFYLISTNSHFQLNAATHTHRALFISTVSPHETRSIDLEASLNNDRALVSHNPNFMPSDRFSYIEIKGSCRGFVLLYCSSSDYLYLWNPTTGVHKNIPFGSNLDAYEHFFYGFGYDQSTDDYLVVSMSADNISSSPFLLKKRKRNKVSPQLEFFSLRDNMWKEIEGPHVYYESTVEDAPVGGSLFNGAIHWFASRPDLENNVIVAFDLMKRKLLDMNFPDEFDHDLGNCGLWVFQEFLSLWAMDYDDNETVEIWVMKEYKMHSSWIKTHVLPIDAIPNKYFAPLISTKSGDIVGTYGLTGYVKYNDEGQLLRHHSYCDDPYGSHVIMYTESLLSLPENNVQA